MATMPEATIALKFTGELPDQAAARDAAGTLSRFFRGKENPGKLVLARAAWVLYGYALAAMPADPPSLTAWDGNSDGAAGLAMEQLAQGGHLDWQKTMRIAKHVFALVA